MYAFTPNKYQNKRLCVALSGGVDSVCLLHYLLSLKETGGFSLSAVHCEHGIRGEESVEDMRFVQTLCQNYGVPLFLFREDCIARAKRDKVSLETAGRAFRKERFATILAENKADFIVTAHHADDEAETVLFRIARGTALSGAGGMKAEDGQILRPFLGWCKDDVYAYAEKYHLEYRQDKTNFETDATRNKLRLEVFPTLENAVAGAKGNFARFAQVAGEDDELLCRLSRALITPTARGFLVAFSKEKPLFRRACLAVMKALGVTRDYTSLHLESLYSLQDLEKNAKVNLPQGVVGVKTKNGISFCKMEENETVYLAENMPAPYKERDFDGGTYAVKVDFAPIVCENAVGVELRFDGDKLPQDAVWRTRQDGDFFVKFGGGKKTLKKFLNEKEIPVEKRSALPLLASEKTGEVYAVCGVEIADKMKVDEKTSRTVYVRLMEK